MHKSRVRHLADALPLVANNIVTLDSVEWHVVKSSKDEDLLRLE